MSKEPSPTSSRKGKEKLPFYVVPSNIELPAQIISEAKKSLRQPLKPLHTKRPETPRDEQRKLFGEASIRDPTNRPPSAFSLGSKHFESDRPVSGTRLTPLDHIPKPRTPLLESGDADPVAVAPKPPADPNRPLKRPSSRTRLMHHSISVDAGLTEGGVKSRSGSLQDVASDILTVNHPPTSEEQVRRVHSGPKERVRDDTSSRPDSSESVVRRRSKAADQGEGSRRESSGSARNSGSRETIESRRESSGNKKERDKCSPKDAGKGRESVVGRREGSGREKRLSSGTDRVSSGGRRESGEKPGSAGRGRNEEETPEEALYFKENVAPLLNEMAAHIKDRDGDRLLVLSDNLYKSLDEGQLLGKACKHRPTMLKTVFKFLDLESPRLLLKLARLILALKVSGNNLTNVCKLVFKVSRDEKNDNYFLEDNVLDLLIETVHTCDHLASADALVYCVGSLKFLSGNSTIVKHLVKRHVIESLARLLKAINRTNLETGKPNEQLGHILVQLTATLRNVADVNSTRCQFLQYGIVDELGRTMELCNHDGDLMLNICRIFSKITLHGDCCDTLGRQAVHVGGLVDLLSKYRKRDDLVVRVCFVLGNITAKNEVARRLLFNQNKSIDILMGLLKYYIEVDLKSQAKSPEKSSENTSNKPSKQEDVIMKVVRVIANLSIDEDVGESVATNVQCVEHLINILEMKKLETSEELVMNVLATINNLSFYTCQNSAITKRQMPLAKVLLQFFGGSTPKDVLAETTRVFGNLSREKAVRDYLTQCKVDETLVSMLDSNHRELVFTACGVLINLMADEEKRAYLKTYGGIRRLVDVLRDFARQDWQLASMVCQTLWNYSFKLTSTNDCFGEKEAEELEELLNEYLDEETALDPTLNPDFEDDLEDYFREAWEKHFCKVANQLLERIESKQSKFVSLQ